MTLKEFTGWVRCGGGRVKSLGPCVARTGGPAMRRFFSRHPKFQRHFGPLVGKATAVLPGEAVEGPRNFKISTGCLDAQTGTEISNPHRAPPQKFRSIFFSALGGRVLLDSGWH
jgi:hypothetical protein